MHHCAQRLHVLRRREGRAAALVGLQHHAGHVLRLDARFRAGCFSKQLEGGVRRAEAVRERDLHEARIEVDDPLLQRRNAARLLRAQRAAVEGLVEGDDDVLVAAARLARRACGTA